MARLDGNITLSLRTMIDQPLDLFQQDLRQRIAFFVEGWLGDHLEVVLVQHVVGLEDCSGFLDDFAAEWKFFDCVGFHLL